MTATIIDIRVPLRAWTIERLSGNATLVGLLARPNPSAGLNGMYQDKIPPAADDAARAALYPALVIGVPSALPDYAAGVNAPDLIGATALLRVEAWIRGRQESLLQAIADAVADTLGTVNRDRPAGLVQSCMLRRWTGHVDTAANGVDYVALGAEWDIFCDL